MCIYFKKITCHPCILINPPSKDLTSADVWSAAGGGIQKFALNTVKHVKVKLEHNMKICFMKVYKQMGFCLFLMLAEPAMNKFTRSCRRICKFICTSEKCILSEIIMSCVYSCIKLAQIKRNYK